MNMHLLCLDSSPNLCDIACQNTLVYMQRRLISCKFRQEFLLGSELIVAGSENCSPASNCDCPSSQSQNGDKERERRGDEPQLLQCSFACEKLYLQEPFGVDSTIWNIRLAVSKFLSMRGKMVIYMDMFCQMRETFVGSLSVWVICMEERASRNLVTCVLINLIDTLVCMLPTIDGIWLHNRICAMKLESVKNVQTCLSENLALPLGAEISSWALSVNLANAAKRAQNVWDKEKGTYSNWGDESTHSQSSCPDLSERLEPKNALICWKTQLCWQLQNSYA